MHLMPNADQTSIRASAAELLADTFGPSFAHKSAQGNRPSTDRTWSALAGMGWFGLGLPQTSGGAELTAVEEALVFHEAGRCLAPTSVLSTVLSAHVAHLAGADDLVAALLEGATRAGIVRPGRIGTMVALDASVGGQLLSFDDGTVTLAEVGSGNLVEPVNLIDPATEAHRWAGEIAGVSLAGDAAQHVRDRAALLTSAYLAGVGAAALDRAVEYAKEREAFGTRIGAFQAIKHRLASAAMHLEAADAQVTYASAHIAEGRPRSSEETDAAKILAVKAAFEATGACIQTHGALGVTWEFDAHLYLTRARLLEHLPHGPRVSMAALSSVRTS